MTSVFADNLTDRHGLAEAMPALSNLKVKSVGCFYQAPFQLGQNEGFLVVTLSDRADALRALVKFNANKITDIALQDINSPAYKNEVLDQEWQKQSTCKTQIIPVLQAAPGAVADTIHRPAATEPPADK